ncbi:hypothetical protein [Rhodococcoides fascians]|uniref:hypothetical protein n=1 Tax=Rhodococcoides fascians TaxID=1828 RepID=UPI00055E5F54|nr:hypothetical protein [Rhodococcus fascians]
MSARITDGAPTCDEVWATLQPGESRWTRLALVHVGPFTASIKRTDWVTDAGDHESSGMQIVVDNFEFPETFPDHDLGAKANQVADLRLLMAQIFEAYQKLDPGALS